MHLSKDSFSTQRAILRDATSLSRILEYTPKKFELGVPGPAMAYQEIRRQNISDFQIDEPIRVQTGLDKMDERVIEAEVENKTLEKLKEIQEQAYKEAHALGMEEGRREAFQATQAEIDRDLIEFREMTQTLQSFKEELLKQNEAHLLRLALHAAARLAHHEMNVDDNCLLDILRKAVADAQVQEEITVFVAESQLQFLETLKKETHRDFDLLKKIKLVPSETVQRGGCMIETNYGLIDAQIEERLGKFWEDLSINLYRTKDKLGAA